MNQKNYNSQREKLILPEYGRHIQTMIKDLLTIDNKEERTRQAYIVIEVMGNLNDVLRDAVDFRHKLWDHLFVMSDFKLDVDSPYEIPSYESLAHKPLKIEYPTQLGNYKQYGKNVRRVIEDLKNKEDGDVKYEIALDLAKYMKFKSYEYNKEYPSNEVIINDFRYFSDGTIELDDDILNGTKLDYNKRPQKGGQMRRPSPMQNSSQKRKQPQQYGRNNTNQKRYSRPR